MMEHLQLDASRTVDVAEIELHNIDIADPEVIKEKLSALSKQQEMYPKASVNVNGRFSFLEKANGTLEVDELSKTAKS
jgi:hypothetical protein